MSVSLTFILTGTQLNYPEPDVNKLKVYGKLIQKCILYLLRICHQYAGHAGVLLSLMIVLKMMNKIVMSNYYFVFKRSLLPRPGNGKSAQHNFESGLA